MDDPTRFVLGQIRDRAAIGYEYHGLSDAAGDVDVLLEIIDGLIGKRPDHHVLEVYDGGWSIQHLAECYPDLLACPIHKLHQALNERGIPLPPAGRYRLTDSGLIATGDDGYAVEVVAAFDGLVEDLDTHGCADCGGVHLTVASALACDRAQEAADG